MDFLSGDEGVLVVADLGFSFLAENYGNDIETAGSAVEIVFRDKVACGLRHFLFFGQGYHELSGSEQFIGPGFYLDEYDRSLGVGHNKVDFSCLAGKVASQCFESLLSEEFFTAVLSPSAQPLCVRQQFLSIEEQAKQVFPILLFNNCMFAVFLGQFCGLARAFAQVIELCPSCLTAADRDNIDDVGRVEGEDAFDALAGDNAADGKHFT